jgi:hypothetical protein
LKHAPGPPPESDSTEFAQAEVLQDRWHHHSRRLLTDRPAVQRPRRMNIWIALIAVLLLTMLIAGIVGGKQTSPTFAMIGNGRLPSTPFEATPPWLAILFLGGLCVLQLLIYAERGLESLGRRFGSLFCRAATALHAVGAAVLVIGPAALYIFSIGWLGMVIVTAMNFRLDTSTPTTVTTTLIERVPRPPGSKLPSRLKLVDWRYPSDSKQVIVTGYASVFEIEERKVTFLVREGAFGWPYAIEQGAKATHGNAP